MLDPLTLDQMRVLVAVAETGSFSAAARRLRRVQSAISQSVQALESTLRLPLFDRSGKVPRPTEAGLAIIEEARRVLAGAQALRARAEAMVGGLEPQLTIAVDHFLPRGPGTAVLRDLNATFPDLPLTLLTEGAAAAERHLRDGVADVAIFPYEMVSRPDLDAEFLVDIEMVPVAAASHPLARHRGGLSRDDLAPHVQLLLVDGAPGAWSRGVLGRRLWRFVSLDTRMNFLLAGFGWCYMPTEMVDGPLAEGRLARLRIPQQDGFRIPLHIVRRQGRRPGVALGWAMARLREALGAPPPVEPSAA